MPQHFLNESEFNNWLGRITTLRDRHALAEVARAAAGAVTETAPAEPAQRPLHELSSEEWRDAAHNYWAEQPAVRQRAQQTIEDLLSAHSQAS